MTGNAKVSALRRHDASTAPAAAATQQYDVSLTGRTLPYFSKAEVSQQLAQLLKIAPPLATRLLGGKRIRLRHGIDQDLAFRYARQLLSIGAECRVELTAIAADQPATPAPPARIQGKRPVTPVRLAPPAQPRRPTPAAAQPPAPSTAAAAPAPAPAAANRTQRPAVELRIPLAQHKKLRLPIVRLATAAIALSLLPVLYLAMIVGTGATLQWHGFAHVHWLYNDLPGAFSASYVGITLVCLIVFALLIKPLLAPCTSVLVPPFHSLVDAPGLIGAASRVALLRQSAARDRNQGLSAAQLGFVIHSGAYFQPLPPIVMPLNGGAQTCAYAALATSVTQKVLASDRSLGVRLAMYIERIQLWLWQHAYVPDAWDLAIIAKLGTSSDLKACGWLMLQGCLQAGRLPLLALARLALLVGPRALQLRSAQVNG